MRILSFDTSTSVLHLSLLEDSRPILERSVEPASSHRSEVGCVLMPEIDQAFAVAGWGKGDVDLIVVGTGPGSFTGIRVAVITARTLAQALMLPLIGISLLETMYAASGQAAPAGIIVSTTSDQYFYGGYQQTPQQAAGILVEPGCGPLSTILQQLSALPLLYADEKAGQVLVEHSTEPLPFLKNIATTQAQLAFDRLSLNGLLFADRSGRQELMETFSWRSVLPLYLRSPSVTLKKSYADPNPAHEHR